jgi:hypothetical protein
MRFDDGVDRRSNDVRDGTNATTSNPAQAKSDNKKNAD